MQTSTFQKKQIAKEVDKAINKDFNIDTHLDEEFLADKNYSWDDLNNLKNDLGNSILEFVGQVNSIITNPQVISNLKDKSNHFQKLITMFFTDINEFSGKVKDLRVQHENFSGHINNLDDFNLYNRIAISYHSLYTELSALITPTLSEIVLTISEVVPDEVVEEAKEVSEKE